MADQNPPDADRTKRVAANVRKKLSGMMLKSKDMPAGDIADKAMGRGDMSADLGTSADDADKYMDRLAHQIDTSGNERSSDALQKPSEELAADKMPARRSKVVRSLTDAYKKSK